ncbi:hypothetical protein B7494_g7720 [Chlorociboria aeruginascens]|nr:hypothetical protein B7494_g7720 [Chlorociboria aeruginascens]
MSTAEPRTDSERYEDGVDNASVASLDDRTPKDWPGGASALNEQSVQRNAAIPAPFHTPRSAIFQTTTIAPSPPPDSSPHFYDSSSLSPLDTSSRFHPVDSPIHASPLSAGLRIQTDVIPSTPAATVNQLPPARQNEPTRGIAKTSSIPIARTPSLKNVFGTSVGSASNFSSAPNSAFSSPMINAMADVTPLPSPLMSGDSPGPWKKLGSRPGSREILTISTDSALIAANGESISSAIANQSKRRAYHGLGIGGAESGLTNAQVNKEKNAEGHVRNRSMSEYIPEDLQVKGRHISVSGSHISTLDPTPGSDASLDMHMRREPHLALQRGLAPIPRPPTPPSSRTGGESSDSDSSLPAAHVQRVHKPRYEYFDAHTLDDLKRRRWRGLRVLGQGTFSKVVLATSQAPDEDDRIDENLVFGQKMDVIQTPHESKIDRKKLVAIKICEHGPKGGASEERVEMSLKRELEIMKTIHHPSLVHLKAWNIEQSRAILVLSYCPGGDLFEVASEHRSMLVPSLLRRIFSELVAAVQYLHNRHIVHRDIKLENVLVNVPHQELAKPTNWQTYPYSVITLTDLGLSRRVADDEKLTTRCGSDDYAAPEVIMGQPYDGRSTDAWSLGVLLYALLESRLPFDPNPVVLPRGWLPPPQQQTYSSQISQYHPPPMSQESSTTKSLSTSKILAFNKSQEQLSGFTRNGALYDAISCKFDDVMTLIDVENFSGEETELTVRDPEVWESPERSVGESRAIGNEKEKGKKKGKGVQKACCVTGANYFAKVDLYANSRLPSDLPPLKLLDHPPLLLCYLTNDKRYIPTFPLICLAAQYSERVYSKLVGQEREAHLESDFFSGGKAMMIKSLSIDDRNTIVFAIRGTQTFMDWAVNLKSAPSSPEGFLDDPGNLCHSGFLHSARKMIPTVSTRLKALLAENPLRSRYSLLITGHSAGGAVASLLYNHMLSTSPSASSELRTLTSRFKRIHCISFGAPPVSLLPLTKPSNPELKKSLFLAFVNEGDPVTRADKAYVRSLLDLYTTTAPVPTQNQNQNESLTIPKPRPLMSPSSLALNKLRSAPKPSKSTSSQMAQPLWPTPEAELSNAGRIVLLRSEEGVRGGVAGKSLKARMDDGVVAQIVTDELLRVVVWGDPVCHMMRLYARRVEILATNAVMGRS